MFESQLKEIIEKVFSGFTVRSTERLSGGLINFVYRVNLVEKSEEGQQKQSTTQAHKAHQLLNNTTTAPNLQSGSIIAKLAKPHFASFADLSLDTIRILIEHAALMLLSDRTNGVFLCHNDGGAEGGENVRIRPRVRAPEVVAFSGADNALMMEDLGPLPHLYDWIVSRAKERTTCDNSNSNNDSHTHLALRMQEEDEQVGRELGKYIGMLHSQSHLNKDKLSHVFQNTSLREFLINFHWGTVKDALKGYGVEDYESLGEAASQYGMSLLHPLREKQCLVMGDLWENSILVNSNQLCTATKSAIADADADATLFVIDWEFAHLGTISTDIAQIISHLWMIADSAVMRYTIENEGTKHGDRSGYLLFVAQSAQNILAQFVKSYKHTLREHQLDKTLPSGEKTGCCIHFGVELMQHMIGYNKSNHYYSSIPLDSPLLKDAMQNICLPYLQQGSAQTPITTVFDEIFF